MRFLLLVLCLFLFSIKSQATFSIVAVDPETGEVGSAGASCLDNNDCGGCGGVIIISGLIPGKGGMNSQAYACLPNINLTNGINQMSMEMSPQEVIDWVVANDACGAANFNSAYRQYGVADLDADNMPRAAGFTGASTDAYTNHIVGANYSIQGNILLGEEILTNMEVAFLTTEGTLADKLMAALQAANVPGADTRCLSAGISSKSAYIRVAKPDDTLEDLYLDLNVPIVADGGEPIDALQVLFDEWATTISGVSDWEYMSPIQVFPNPTKGAFTIELPAGINEENSRFRLIDLDGKVIFEQKIVGLKTTVSTEGVVKRGLFLLQIIDGSGDTFFSKKIVFE